MISKSGQTSYVKVEPAELMQNQYVPYLSFTSTLRRHCSSCRRRKTKVIFQISLIGEFKTEGNRHVSLFYSFCEEHAEEARRKCDRFGLIYLVLSDPKEVAEYLDAHVSKCRCAKKRKKS